MEDVTSLALLKSTLDTHRSTRTFIIINIANNSNPKYEPLQDHEQMFHHLYDTNSRFLKEAYPPCVVVHTGDTAMDKRHKEIKENYEKLFAKHSLCSTWVYYAATVRQVVEVLKKPVSSMATNLPVVFHCSAVEEDCSCNYKQHGPGRTKAARRAATAAERG